MQSPLTPTLFPYTTLFRSCAAHISQVEPTSGHMVVERVLGDREAAREAQANPVSLSRSAPSVERDRKSTRLNSSHRCISYAVFCLKKKTLRYFTISHFTIP